MDQKPSLGGWKAGGFPIQKKGMILGPGFYFPRKGSWQNGVSGDRWPGKMQGLRRVRGGLHGTGLGDAGGEMRTGEGRKMSRLWKLPGSLWRKSDSRYELAGRFIRDLSVPSAGYTLNFGEYHLFQKRLMAGFTTRSLAAEGPVDFRASSFLLKGSGYDGPFKLFVRFDLFKLASAWTLCWPRTGKWPDGPESSSPGEFHPQALTDPDVTVSRHPALIIPSRRHQKGRVMIILFFEMAFHKIWVDIFLLMVP
jgi:hypothetical protein